MFQPWVAHRHRGKAVGHYNKGIYQPVSGRHAHIRKKTHMRNEKPGNRDFANLVDCPLTREAYEALLVSTKQIVVSTVDKL